MNSLWQRLQHEIVYEGVVTLARLLFLVCARVRVRNYGSPSRGPFILAANHISHFDPPLLSAFGPRRIDWIAVRELFSLRFFHWFFTTLAVIPVDRSGADRTALRTAVKRLQAGRVVGIFPEGGIRDGDRSLVNGAPMRPGVAVLCAMSGAPIVPVVILGSDRLYQKKNWLPWRRAPVWIGLGAPISAPEGCTGDTLRRHLTQELSAALIGLKNRLMEDFSLTTADLPHSPQTRMKEP